jgi:hypothetical protein
LENIPPPFPITKKYVLMQKLNKNATSLLIGYIETMKTEELLVNFSKKIFQ